MRFSSSRRLRRAHGETRGSKGRDDREHWKPDQPVLRRLWHASGTHEMPRIAVLRARPSPGVTALRDRGRSPAEAPRQGGIWASRCRRRYLRGRAGSPRPACRVLWRPSVTATGSGRTACGAHRGQCDPGGAGPVPGHSDGQRRTSACWCRWRPLRRPCPGSPAAP